MTSLPPERDLPEAARTATRARIVTAAASRPDRSRRWVPIAAAAALAAVVAGSAVGVSLTRGAAVPPVPAAASTSPAPSDATLLEACRRFLIGLDPQRTDPGRLQVIARFADEYGIMLLAQSTRTKTTCTFHPDGTPADPGHGSSGGERLGYLDPRSTVPVLGAGWGIGAVTTYGGRPAVDTREVTGIVKREVAKVVVIFQGHPPITAVPGVGAFVARLVIPAGSAYPNDPYMIFVGYDKDGHELGRTYLNLPLPSTTPTTSPSAAATTTTSATPPPAAGGTDPSTLLKVCAANASPDIGLTVGTLTLSTLFADAKGYFLSAASATSYWYCEFDRKGALVQGASGISLVGPPAYVPAGAPAPLTTMSHGDGGPIAPTADYATLTAVGLVARGVAKVRVTWKGSAPVWAAVTGPNWAARVVVPRSATRGNPPATAVAYDRNGRQLGTWRF
jgi:hypothetical protein